jgi:quinol monooxygenase YgiN
VIVLLATLHARPGRREDLTRMLDAIRVDAESEPGTLTFAVHTVRDDADAVVCYEAYADADAMTRHREGPALQALMAVIGDLIEGAPQITYLEPYSNPSR